jgi:hypothetical protein
LATEATIKQRVIGWNAVLRSKVEKHPALLIDLPRHALCPPRRFVARFEYANDESLGGFASVNGDYEQ